MPKHNRNEKSFDLTVTILILVTSAVLQYLLKPPVVLGWLLYLLLPSIYLMCAQKKNYKKIFFALLLFGLIFGFVFDFIITVNNGWVVTNLTVPFRLFGVYPLIDDIVGFVLMTLFIIVFYEHFLDDEKKHGISRHFMHGLIPSITVLVVVLTLYLIDENLLKVRYVYLFSGLAAIIAPIYVSIRKPKILHKLLSLSFFFFFVWFIAELVAVSTKGWIFPGTYVGWVEVLGLGFPFEELFFWMLFYAATVVSYYELLIDDYN